MAAKSKSRGATKPTGPNARLQGKALPTSATPDNRGPVDGKSSNGNWDCGCVEGNVSTPIIRGSRKSF